MENKRYTYKEFIQAYIAGERNSYVHEDFKNYYVGLFNALKNLFGIHFTRDDLPQFPENNDLLPNTHRSHALHLFHPTIRSYLAIWTPFSGFLEAGGLLEVFQVYGLRINQIAEENRKAHLEMLDGLFRKIYGEVDKVFTSEDLMNMGFDDSKEPKIEDYFDYI